MFQAAKFNCLQTGLGIPFLVSGLLSLGCAGGAWLESPIDAELPLDKPEHGYPTALAPGKAPLASAANAVDPRSALAENANPAKAASLNQLLDQAAQDQRRPDRAPPPRAALAVIPSQYVHQQAAQLPPTLSPATAAASQHSAASTSRPASSSALPQLDLSFLDSLAASTSATASTPPLAVAKSEVVHPDHAVQPAGHQEIAPASEPEKLETTISSLISGLETEIRERRQKNASDEELPRLEQQLRLAYLVGDRTDDAVAAIESLEPAQREAFKNLMFGLGVWLSPDEARRAPLRTAKVLHSLRDATSELTPASKLELKNLAFCERVDQFGWYAEFPRREFQPKQQVILYAEVENFAAEPKGAGSYETELQGSYEILDSSGQIIASRQLQLDKEVCRNYRRDYFLAYRIYLPDNIAPGRYRLELTVEDLKAKGKYQGRKLGDGVIEFTIR
jgi:hypothetical protein